MADKGAEKTADEAERKPAAAVRAAQTGLPTVTWDDSNMGTSYANVVNVASTREEVTLFFGTNQTWNIRDTREVTVRLSDRIVLNPYAAKRLWTLIGNVLAEYENRYGALNLEDVGGAGGN